MKKVAADYVGRYEARHGPNSRSTFGGHAWDAWLLLQRAIPVALAKGRPGTREFRAALRDALENSGRLAVSQGVLRYTATDHFGFQPDTGVMLKVVNGDWKLEGR